MRHLISLRGSFVIGLTTVLVTHVCAQRHPGEYIDRHIRPFAEAGYFSGTVLVARRDSIVYEQSFGNANDEHAVPFTPSTLSGIASLTKPMTKVIVARLVEEGKLSFDDPLSRWIPDFPQGQSITVRHLFDHRAGIPHRLTQPDQETVPRTAQDMVEFAKTAGLEYAPGERTSYSSGGFSVLARVLELAGGDSYQGLLEHYVFEPAGMEQSVHANAQQLVSNRAQPYMNRGRGRLNGPLQDLSFLVGAGSVYSTARDIFLMVRALLDGKLGQASLEDQMGQDGMSWNGSTNGYRAWMDWYKESDETYVLIANVQSGANNYIREDLPRLIRGDTTVTRAMPAVKWVDVPRARLEEYAGTYELRPGSPMKVRPDDGGLYVNQWFLIPTSDTTFFSPQDFGRITAKFDESGYCTHFLWEFTGGSVDMNRVKESPR